MVKWEKRSVLLVLPELSFFARLREHFIMSAVAELPSTEKSAYELERGKPMPSYNHGILQARLVVLLARAGSRYEVASEVALSISGKSYTPDICLFPARPTDWDHDQIKVLTAPILAVERLLGQYPERQQILWPRT